MEMSDALVLAGRILGGLVVVTSVVLLVREWPNIRRDPILLRLLGRPNPDDDASEQQTDSNDGQPSPPL